jgi:hypothetical protein
MIIVIYFYTKLPIVFCENPLYNVLMRIAKRVGIITVLAMILVSAGQPVFAAPASESEWCPETGHFIRGEFLKFYHSVSDPLTIFGFPITDERIDQTGHITQYFQRARFDLDNSKPTPVVTLGKLGYLLYDDQGEPYNIPQDGPTCRLFQATGKTVCYAFLQFYDANQGEKYFGDPISGLELRDGGVIVQYFTYVRMEWHFNLPEGRKVKLTQLGRLAYDKYVIDPSGLYTPGQPIPGDFIIKSAPVTSLNARAYVRNALVGTGSTQTVYLIVKDQNMQPVAGVQASIVIIGPDGSRNVIRPPGVTDANGVFQYDIPIGNFPPRQVVLIDFTAEFQKMSANAETWFRIWY